MFGAVGVPKRVFCDRCASSPSLTEIRISSPQDFAVANILRSILTGYDIGSVCITRMKIALKGPAKFPLFSAEWLLAAHYL